MAATGVEVLAAIGVLTDDQCYPPTVREIASECNLSTTSAHYWVQRLRGESRVTYQDGKMRTIRLTDSGRALSYGSQR